MASLLGLLIKYTASTSIPGAGGGKIVYVLSNAMPPLFPQSKTYRCREREREMERNKRKIGEMERKMERNKRKIGEMERKREGDGEKQ